MSRFITWIAGSGIVAGLAWLIGYARSIRKGYRHDPGARQVWWTPGGGGHGGGGQVPPLVGEEDHDRDTK